MRIEDLLRQRFWFSKAKVELSEATFFGHGRTDGWTSGTFL